MKTIIVELYHFKIKSLSGIHVSVSLGYLSCRRRSHLFVVFGEGCVVLLVDDLGDPYNLLVGVTHGHTEERVGVVGQGTVHVVIVSGVLEG